MVKTDCAINNWVADWLVGNYDWISNATASCEENYGVDDVVFTATTTNGDEIVKYDEVKSIKGGFCLKYGENWNEWFSADNPNGIIKKMKFGNVPPSGMPIDEVPYFWEPETLEPTDEEMPEEWKGKHIYFLNATDKRFNIINGKAYKVISTNACLTYIASDGLIQYSPSKLREAVLGYAWYHNKSHTEEYNRDNKPSWELKMVIDLERGSYNKANPPQELFKK